MKFAKFLVLAWDRIGTVWFYGVTNPWMWLTGCMWKRHRWFVVNITDGNVRVWCQWCRVKREATQQELEANSAFHYTKEQHEAQRAKEEAIYDSLREHGYKVD